MKLRVQNMKLRVQNMKLRVQIFVILHFHCGIKITPVVDADVGLFDIPLVMHALQRGVACKVDLSDRWNFWEVYRCTCRRVTRSLRYSTLTVIGNILM
jgi:hypothetical protein